MCQGHKLTNYVKVIPIVNDSHCCVIAFCFHSSKSDGTVSLLGVFFFFFFFFSQIYIFLSMIRTEGWNCLKWSDERPVFVLLDSLASLIVVIVGMVCYFFILCSVL